VTTLITPPWTFPYSTEAPIVWTCSSWITSTIGSERDTPWQGHVKLVPSIRNMFSFTADPNTDTVLTVPLPGEDGDTPGVLRIRSNMLNRREGIVRM
jgi:hypothetical protein